MIIRNASGLHALVLVGALSSLVGCRATAPDVTPASLIVADGSSPRSALTLASGSSVTLTGTVMNAGGEVLPTRTVAWASSDLSVVTVTPTGVITGLHAGQASITASIGNIISPPLAVTVTPGAATRLAIRTQPAGAASGAALLIQPVVEIQDAAGNFVSSSAPVTITAIVATGGGTITGSTATATAGVATFNNLAVAGTVGDRTLSFSAAGLTPVTSTGLALAAGAPSQLVIRTQPFGAVSGAPLVAQPTIDIRDANGNLATGYSGAVTASIGSGASQLTNATATAVRGVATFSQLIVNGSPGTVTLAFAAPSIPAVTSQPFALATALQAARRP